MVVHTNSNMLVFAAFFGLSCLSLNAVARSVEPDGLIRNRCLLHVLTWVSCENVSSPDAMIPHPNDCNLFLYCAHPSLPAVCRQCPAGLHFNPDLHVCDWPDQAGCVEDNSDESSSGEEVVDESTEDGNSTDTSESATDTSGVEEVDDSTGTTDGSTSADNVSTSTAATEVDVVDESTDASDAESTDATDAESTAIDSTDASSTDVATDSTNSDSTDTS